MRRREELKAREGSEPGFRNLRVWEKSFELAVAIFKIADRIPEALGISLNGQMRIAALSIPSFLARSQAKVSNKDFLRGLCLSQNALSELETHMELCSELGYASELDMRRIGTQMKEVRRMTSIVISKLRAVVNEGLSLQALSDEIAGLISDEKHPAQRSGL
jgi:four helix bundle protein